MTDRKPKKKRKPPRPSPGQRKTIVASKKYRIRVFLGRDAAGKRHYHSETVHGTAGQAEDRIREIIRRHRAGEPIKANADSFGAFLDEFLEAKRLSIAESSLKTYAQTVEKHIRPTLGKKLLARITADDIQGLYNKLHTDGLTRISICNVHVTLGTVLKMAVRRKKLIGSPMAGVEVPKEWAEAEGEDEERAMTPEQVAKFAEAAEGSELENLYNLAFHVGFRPGELLALKWDDLDAQAKTLRINQSIAWSTSTDWYLKKPKTKSSRRTLPLTQAMIDVLSAQRRRQLEARLKAGKLWTNHNFIFTNATGGPFSQHELYNDFKRVLKAAGLPETFSPKTARHTMATLLLAGGTNPKAVQERMGHARITTTLQQYAHVTPGMQADVSEEIERLLGGKK